jgi:tRNA pseudouridine55 synthase
MTPRSIVLDKQLGETPLHAIERWKEAHPEYAAFPACYAGRLDPMATGTLLVLLGDECKRQARYHNLDKEYEIEVLLDLGSDTGDVLGIPAASGQETHPGTELTHVLRMFTGTHTVPYPAFSSKTVAGKPLFLYALEGALDTIDLPTHPETIYRLELYAHARIGSGELEERIVSLLAHAPRTDDPEKRLGADFRQGEVRNAWKILFSALSPREYSVLRLRVTCASGTYMRTLAERIGAALGTRGMAFSIRRTRIGRYLPLPMGAGAWVQQF